ncbi:MAG: hypothetical protein L0227_17830 [Chloroflexi bacterium]|nr:hypothetical protein [Chloroflexota bacterium]
MSEPQLSGGGPTSDSDLVCPWCSAALPSADLVRCPSCGAALKEPDAAAVPGVTQIDVEAILKSRAPAPKSRGIIGWLAGEYEAEEPGAPPPGTLEPPDEAVQREILRLELAALEAEVLARQAEVVAEVATETGRPVDLDDLGLADADDDAEAAEAAEADAAPAADAGDAVEPDADAGAATADSGDATGTAEAPDTETREG